jgi:hypothetical protein
LVTGGGVVPIPVALPDGAQILVGQMDVNLRLVQFQLVMVPNKPETAPRWVIPLEVYYKPFTILGVAGSAVDAAGRADGDAASDARCALRSRPYDGQAVPNADAETYQTARTRAAPRSKSL